MKPIMILAMIAGGVTGASIFSVLNCGLLSTASPGSFFSILAVAPRSDYIPILIGIFASAIVSFLVASVILKFSKDEEEDETLEQAIEKRDAMKAEGSVQEEITKSNTLANDYSQFVGVKFACDAGMGSSVMGASILGKKIRDAGLDIPVEHIRINDLTDDPSYLIVTAESLLDRVDELTPHCTHETVENFMSSPTYDRIVEKFKKAKKTE